RAVIGREPRRPAAGDAGIRTRGAVDRVEGPAAAVERRVVDTDEVACARAARNHACDHRDWTAARARGSADVGAHLVRPPVVPHPGPELAGGTAPRVFPRVPAGDDHSAGAHARFARVDAEQQVPGVLVLGEAIPPGAAPAPPEAEPRHGAPVAGVALDAGP